jgi:hypothetical protein
VARGRFARSKRSGLWLPQQNGAAGAMDRRTFVRTTGGVLAAATVGCGTADSLPPRLGTVRVLLTGLDASATSGGTAVVTPVGGGTAVTIDLPASGDQSAQVPAGSYTVQYLPPSSHQLAAGQQGTQTVTITANATTTVTFALVFVPPSTAGTIVITVTGLTGSPADGGSAVAQRTDAAGGPIAINISAAGSGSNSSVPAGTYTITYTPPSGFTLGSGVTNPVSGEVVGVGATTTVTFDVVAQAGTGAIYDFGFEDGTFGAFRTGNSGTLGSIGWAIDATTAAKGSKSAKHHVLVDTGNQAYTAYYTAASYYGEWYVRFAYRQSAGFDNTYPIKVLRVQRDYGDIYGSVMHNADGPNQLEITASVSGNDFGALGPNVNLPAPTPSDLAGAWHWFEFYLKIVDATHTNYKMWVDDVLYFDYQTAHPNTVRASLTFNQFFFGDVFNQIGTAGDVWYDSIGVGTQKMGIPAS